MLKDAGVVDAGGAGFLLFLDAALHVVDGEPLPEPDEGAGPQRRRSFELVARRARGATARVDVSEQRYEVMYFLDLADERIEAFKEAWGAIGDSIVVVGGDGLWNCHVHTNDIGAAIEAALDLDGRPRRSASPTCSRRSPRSTPCARRRSRGGAGVTCRRRRRAAGGRRARSSRSPAATGSAELFGQLGVQGMVTGGQTMNPSTAELLDAVERGQRRPGRDPARTTRTSSRWPSRSTPSRPRRVRVVPTTSMPEGARRARRLRPGGRRRRNADGDDRGRRVASSPARSPRPSATRRADVGPITDGDWIGHRPRRRHRRRQRIARRRGDRRCSTSSSTTSARSSRSSRAPTPTPAHTDVLLERGSPSTVPTCEVEVHHGGQPLYPYLVRRRVSGEPASDHAARARRRSTSTGCKGVGEQEAGVAARRRRRHRARPAHDLPAALGRPHERGARRRPRARRRRRSCSSRVRSRSTKRTTRNRRTMVNVVVGDGSGPAARRVLQPAVARAPAARGPAGRPVRQGRRVPRRAADDEPGGRPDRRPHRPHRADLPAEREGRS